MRRPRTAATTTVWDENRIKDKIKYFENIEGAIDTDIEKILAGGIEIKKKAPVLLTKKLVLECGMADELGEVQTLMMRDKGIDEFDDTRGKEGFKLIELFNIECLLASHNHIKDLFGVQQLVTLVELNLSFNEISDLTGLENLTLLESLHINRNQVTIMTPI